MTIQQITEQQEQYEQAFNQLSSAIKAQLDKNTEDFMNASRRLAEVTAMSIEEAALSITKKVENDCK